MSYLLYLYLFAIVVSNTYYVVFCFVFPGFVQTYVVSFSGMSVFLRLVQTYVASFSGMSVFLRLVQTYVASFSGMSVFPWTQTRIS